MSDDFKPRMKRQWVGDTVSQTILVTPAVAETIQLIETTATGSDLSEFREVTHKFTVLQFSIRRLLTTALGGVGFIVWKGKVLLGTATPAQPYSPQSSSKFFHSDSDIMLSGVLPVPPTIRAAADDTLLVSNEVVTDERYVKVMRKVSRDTEGVFLQMTASTASVVSVQVTWRTLLLY